jgi:SAM-dependent methyltransferase
MAAPSTTPDFWNPRYASGRTPWDYGDVPPALQRYLHRHPGQGARALVPGCGSGYEIKALALAGYNVTAIDFSPAAIARARAHVGPALADRVIEGDFFTYDFAEAPFDFIYERTFLCALPPPLWPKIVARTASLLAAGGTLAGLYFFGDKEDGPPFGLAPEDATALLGRGFILVADQPVPDGETLPLFAGRERWQERRRSSITFG